MQITLQHHTSLYSTHNFRGCILWSPFQREFGNCSTVLSNLHSLYKIWGVHNSDNLCCGLVDGQHFGQTYWPWPKFPLDVGALCHSSKEKRKSLMVWKLLCLTLMQECFCHMLVFLVLMVCQCCMYDARSYDSRLSTEGSDLTSFMSRKGSICQLCSKFLPLHESNK